MSFKNGKTKKIIRKEARIAPPKKLYKKTG